ncbi:M48 family metallopeptidase [Thermomicrobium sp.]
MSVSANEPTALRPWLVPALLLLLIPGVAFLAGRFVRDQVETEVWQAIGAAYGSRAAGPRELFDLGERCELPAWSTLFECQLYAAAGILLWSSVLTGLFALGLLAYVADRASQARKSLERLPEFFRAAVRSLGIGAALLGISLSLLLAGSLTLVTLVLLEAVPRGFVLGIPLLGLYTASRTAKAALSLNRPLEHRELALPVGRSDAPGLWRAIDDVARQLGTEPPDHLIVTNEPNCYAIEVPVQTLSGRVTGRTLCLSLPLLYLWDEEELRSVIAHELAHFHGADTGYSRDFAPAFRSATDAVDELQKAVSRDWRALATLPLVPLFTCTIERFALATASHSREREFIADAAGARVAGGLALATALLKVACAVPAWSVYLARLSEEPDDPPPAGQAVAWLTANRLDAPVPPDWLAADRLPHPIDSHPPLVQRLERLGTTIDRAWRAALMPNRPSASLLPQAAELDRRLTERISELAHLIRSKARTSDKKSENDRSSSVA